MTSPVLDVTTHGLSPLPMDSPCIEYKNKTFFSFVDIHNIDESGGGWRKIVLSLGGVLSKGGHK